MSVSGVLGSAAMAVFVPSAAIRESWSTIADAAKWAGVSPALWTSVAAELGDAELSSMLHLAAVADDEYRAALNRIPTVTTIQRSALNLLFNAVKVSMGVATRILDALASPASIPSSTTGAGTLATMGETTTLALVNTPKVKLSQVIDQAKDTEVAALEEAKIAELRKVYATLFGDAPMETSEVTDNQIFALYYLVSNGLVPYADFAVWGPYGTRFERKMRFTARLIDSTGTWRTTEVPGPDCIESWRKCWRTFAVAAIMCGVATPATLTRYETRFEERCERYHKSWHLCVQADTRCRSE